jgi:succinate dehydrogenase / fumarate reductase, flavoprotein subunit
VPRDVASRAAKERCDEGFGVGESKQAVYLDFKHAIERDGEDVIRSKYGNLFHMYEKITAENPYKVPMRIYPAVHYTMGGLWVDYNLESSVPGLFVLGEANFSDHGANRLGASALMQGLADGYFVLPYTVGDHIGKHGSKLKPLGNDHPVVQEALESATSRVNSILAVNGTKSPDSIHRQLGQIMWDKCGMARNEAGLKQAVDQIRALRDVFWSEVKVLGTGESFNQSLEHAGRLADFLEFAELFATDALHREESCGGHFREEHQTEDNEARRDDENFCYAAAWEFQGVGEQPVLHKEPMEFNEVALSTRSYK